MKKLSKLIPEGDKELCERKKNMIEVNVVEEVEDVARAIKAQRGIKAIR